MRAAFGHWKYIAKNIWFVLPFAVLPAIFLALSLDYTSVGTTVRTFFTVTPREGFVEYFRTWSLIRIDGVLGGVYSALAFLAVIWCAVPMLVLVEKHMRIGKRTLSGLMKGSVSLFFSVFLVVLGYLALYEVWAVVLSAVLFVIAQIKITALAYVFYVLAFLLLTFALFYVATVFYLWLPCRQATGFGPYEAFLYSYRLMTGVRWKLILGFTVSFFSCMVCTSLFSLLPEAAFRVMLLLLYAALFLSFLIRMETVYFETDKLDREDVLKSYRGY